MQVPEIDRAKELVESESEHALVYAALECRLAIERIIQSKLAHYQKRHGSKLLYKHWQPAKALKILCQLEPDADLSYSVRITPENQSSESKPWSYVGKHEALSSSWVTKNYNKLGSYLHINEQKAEKEKIKKYLLNVISELERAGSSTVTMNIAKTAHFGCTLCDQTIHCNVEALPNIKEVVCPTQNCPATYHPSSDTEDNWKFELKTTVFECGASNCEGKTPILDSQLEVGLQFECAECSHVHRIESKTWAYAAKAS